MRIEVSKSFKTSLEKVYNWWTDFQDSDKDLSDRITRSRQVIQRGEDVVIYKDVGQMLGIRYEDTVKVTLHPPDMWIAEYSSDKFYAKSIYTLKRVSDYTVLYMVTDIKFKGWLRLFAWIPLIRHRIEETISKEWDDFVKFIEDETV